MGKNKKVSIIVPVYNVEKYLQICIDSIVNQTLKDIEAIFVNDASTDHSLEILRKNEERYPDIIRVINCTENRKQGAARNIAIREAKGEYIGFVDSDDFVHPCMYERLYKKAEGCDAVFGRYTDVSENATLEDQCGEDVLRPHWSEEIISLEGRTLTKKEKEHVITGIVGGIWCNLWRRDCIVDNNVWFPEELKYEDNYWTSLMRCYLNKVAFVPDAVYFYRTRQTSTVRTKNAKDHYDRIKIEDMLEKTVCERGMQEIYASAWEYLYTFRRVFTTYFHFHEHLDDPDIKTQKELLRKLRKRYPRWWNNEHLKRETSWKYRMLCFAISLAPATASFVLRRTVYKGLK